MSTSYLRARRQARLPGERTSIGRAMGNGVSHRWPGTRAMSHLPSRRTSRQWIDAGETLRALALGATIDANQRSSTSHLQVSARVVALAPDPGPSLAA